MNDRRTFLRGSPSHGQRMDAAANNRPAYTKSELRAERRRLRRSNPEASYADAAASLQNDG